MCELGQAQQPASGRGDIGLAHQCLADQKAARTRGGEAVEVGGGADPAFGDDDAVRRHLRRQPFGGAEIDRQRLQIAVVDADQPRVESEGAVELGPIVHLDQHVEADFGCRRRQLARHRHRRAPP